MLKQVLAALYYTTGVLNAWIWLADESSKVCNYFQGFHARPK